MFHSMLMTYPKPKEKVPIEHRIRGLLSLTDSYLCNLGASHRCDTANTPLEHLISQTRRFANYSPFALVVSFASFLSLLDSFVDLSLLGGTANEHSSAGLDRGGSCDHAWSDKVNLNSGDLHFVDN